MEFDSRASCFNLGKIDLSKSMLLDSSYTHD